MGAISGVFDAGITGEDCAVTGTAVFERMAKYQFDHKGEWSDRHAHMGCGIRYNTPESRIERLPRSSDNLAYAITADAIIDNRAELMREFGIQPDVWPQITDSELILKAYEKWGHSCPSYLIGDFTFAIWEAGSKELYLARDAMGARTLYYTHAENRFAFCTVEKPLLGLFGSQPSLNENWMTDFLAIPGIPQETQCVETVYQGIYQLPPAHYGVWNGMDFRTVRYWDPALDIKPIRYRTDEEYVEAFRRIFDEAVACRLRTTGETGILLSGGMDSTSIASTAAPMLSAQGQQLYGYTSIPLPDFKSSSGNSIYDETKEVELVKEAYSNLDVQFHSLESQSCLTDLDELVDIFEQPYKVFQNMTWYHPLLKKAAKNGCTVMLNGQWGNYSISYGHFTVHLLTLYKKGKLLSVAREVSKSSKLAEASKKRMFRQALTLVHSYHRQERLDRQRKRDNNPFQHALVSPSKAKQRGTLERMEQMQIELRFDRLLDYEEERKSRSSVLPLAHIGAMETKLSLADGITIRDPSRDKRVYEFCLAIPPEQFVRNGQDRYLLRRAMEGRLPDPIRLNFRNMGRQGFDWLERLKPELPQMMDEAERLLANDQVAPFLNISRLRDDLDRMGSGDTFKPNARALWDIIVAIIMQRFVEGFRQDYRVQDTIMTRELSGEIRNG
ncbi:asparagine synthase-related protein [Paenibacillus sp. sgz500958]|uniref:asparagine synthase-related protein n=1 Tax=Paenibacillus sp. sgz500958 TaxID=3242475 RepID=UPI0036D24EF5